MKLAEKGSSAEITNKSNDVKVTTKWSGDIDFDTAALYQKPDGTKGIVYFGTTGANQTHGYLDKEPFIMLDKDSLSGGEENLIVSTKAMETYKSIHIVVWDYKAIKRQKKPEFNTSDIRVHIDEHIVHPETKPESNFIEMAVIRNDNGKISVMNKSIQGELRSVDDSDMWNIINNR